MGGKTSNESKYKYNSKAYDRINLIVKKGQKEIIKQYADKQNKSLNSYISDAIIEQIKKDSN